ncbi:MAG TPA: VWA domain-containing protein [Acidobacteriota bacterium]
MKLIYRSGCAFTLAAALCLAAAHFLAAQDQFTQQSLDGGNIQRLQIQVTSGQVRVRGWDRPTIDVRAKKQAGQEVSLTPTAGELRVGPKEPTQPLYVDLYVPARLDISATSSQADVLIHGIGGQIQVKTESGKAHFYENPGRVQAVTNSGEIRFLAPEQYQSSLDLKSQSGNIHVTLNSDDFKIHAVTLGSIFVNGQERVTGLSANKETVFDSGNGARPAVQLASGSGKVIIQTSRAGLAASSTSPANDASRPAASGAARTPSGSYPSATRRDAPANAPDPYGRGPRDESVPFPRAETTRPDRRSGDTSGDSGNKKNYKVYGSTVDSGYSVRSNVDYVNLNVSVRDRVSSRSVGYLRKEDFLVYEDGQPQNVEKFLTAETPFSLLLLIDTSGSTGEFVDLMKEASINFLRQLKPQDEVAVAVFNTDVDLLADFSTRRVEAERAIRSIRSHGGTAFYDALETSIHGYMEHIRGRKAIVVFTDGVDNQLEGHGGSTTTFNQLMRGIQEEDTIIYPVFLDSDPSQSSMGGFGRILGDILNGGPRIRIGGGRSTRDIYERAREQLASIAEQTGGRMYTPHRIEDLDGVYRQIADDLRIQYTLSYASSNPAKDGSWRRIQVRIQGHPEYLARTRLGYYSNDASRAHAESRRP